jgi:GTP 3',8-cyclase
MALIDIQGRTVNYLRLSITDRCNLRCSYCMPKQGVAQVDHDAILSYEDLYRIACCAVSLGIEKIRITGGEPLVRLGIVPFLRRLSGIPGLKELVVTTNGILLAELSADLRNAGVQRLNVSLDSLDAETFRRITRRDSLSRVLAGIEKAKSCGLPIKLNMVVMAGVNDHEIIDFVHLAMSTSMPVRFIEYMPVIRKDNWQELVFPGATILAKIQSQFSLQPVLQSWAAGPASNYRISGTDGIIGVITPVSEHFCSQCNRLRVTSTGKAKGCLFSNDSYDLKPALQSENDLLLRNALVNIVSAKPLGHLMNTSDCQHEAFSMASVGG